MAQITSYDIAGMWLEALDAPNTPAMRRAVAIWLRFESGNSVRGNNPWNLHSGPSCTAEKGYCPGYGAGRLPGQIGTRYAGTGDRNVAVFDTLQHGVQANANNLIRLAPSYGYGRVIREARSGDAVGFLTALQDSSWSAGHYGHSKLVNAFLSSFNYNNHVNLYQYGSGSAGPVSSGGGGGGGTGHNTSFDPADLSTWETVNIKQWVSGVLQKPDNYVIQQADINRLMDDVKRRLDSAGQFPGRADVEAGIANALADTLVGKKIGDLTGTVKLPPVATGNEDLFATLGDVAKTIGDVFAFFLDVQNLGYILLLTGGSILAFYGFALLVSVSGPASFEIEPPRLARPTTTVSTVRKGSKGETITTSKTK